MAFTAPISVQQVLQAAFGESEKLQVFHFDPCRGEAALCRIFVRRGSCKWGNMCRHSHELDLSGYSLRARRGAAMPALVHGDPKAALDTANENIAFVLSGSRAVYDYEDPDVARRFLVPQMQGHDLWSWLPMELAIETLWSAGACGAVAASMACKDWGPPHVAQGLRERVYLDVAGVAFPGCSWRHLCDLMLTRRLMMSVRYPERSMEQACGPMVNICQPAPVCLLFLDGAVTFALLRSGEVRCHRSSTGQILGQSQRLGKGRCLQAAALLGCEAFVLGDDHGGLLLLQRDDLSESQQLRSQGKSGVVALAALQENPQACLCANMDSIELIQVSVDEDVTARIHLLCRLDCMAVPIIPAMCTYSFGEEDYALVAAGADVWSIRVSEGEMKRLAGAFGDCSHADEPLPDVCMACHVCALSSSIVIASTGSSHLQWFSRAHSGEVMAEETMHSNSGVVVDLSACGDLCVALHAFLTVTLWQGALRREVLRIAMNGIGHSVSLTYDTLAIGSAQSPGGRVRGSGGTSTLQVATLPLFVEKLEAQKEPKTKSKPAKMYAHKSRGGRKNEKGKQSRQ